MSTRLSLLVLAPLALMLSACPTSRDPLACMDGCSHQDVKTFCDIDGVYPGTELANECIAPPSADACNRVETCPTADKPLCSDESMGVCVECLTGQDCDTGEVCNASNECEAFSCTQGNAGDAACAGVDASQPYCGPGDVCVGCLESANCTVADSAICDSTDFQCRGCAAHPECGSKVCGIDTGICADEADIVYVATTGVDGASCGTLASPCASIAGTEGATKKLTATRNIISVGAGVYDVPIVLDGVSVSLVGEDGANIAPSLGVGGVAVSITGTSDVRFDNVDIDLEVGGSTSSVALKCETAANSASVSYANGTISGSAGLGVSANRCDLAVTRSTVTDNAGGGIDITASGFTIVNNFIVQNGANLAEFGGVRILNLAAATQALDFNTIAGNQKTGLTGVATNLDCTTSTVLSASSNVVYDGVNIGTAVPDLVTNSNCSLAFSNIKGGPTTNDNIDDVPTFVNVGLVDYHLQSGSPCINAADPAATLTVDFDGDPRAQGGRSDMGADEVE